MEICKIQKNIEEIQRRASLPTFGDTSEIVILEKVNTLEFVVNENEIEMNESSDADEEVYVPILHTSVVKQKPQQNDTYTPPSCGVHEQVSVRISNYDPAMKRSELIEIISKHTQVKFHRFHMVMDQESGKSRGFGFINLYDKKTALQLISDLEVVVVDNLRLCVELAKNKR